MTDYRLSLYETVKSMPAGRPRDYALLILESLKGRQRWEALRRPDQIPPTDSLWEVWIFAGGRGGGKTRTGAEETKEYAEAHPGSRLILAAQSARAVREVLVEGESGILSLYESHDPNTPKYIRPAHRLEWPNGSIAYCVSADNPDSIRGIDADFAWADEVASWKTSAVKGGTDAWDNLRFAVRRGRTPRIIVTTSPRKSKMLKKLHKELKRMPLTMRMTSVHTFANRHNLNDAYLRMLAEYYEGTEEAKTDVHGQWPWKL